MKRYEGGYSTYRATHLRQFLAQQADYSANQKRLAQLEALVKRLELTARARPNPKAGKRLRARRSQLAREEAQAVEKPTLGVSAIDAENAIKKPVRTSSCSCVATANRLAICHYSKT